ncbi:MAG: ComEC/Rec2 family competence protein [Thermoflexales bacterium]|nr:ComEC/Rec2 family competence protein [Thermoflexales bacterium]
MPLVPLGVAWLIGITLASTLPFPPVAFAPLILLAGVSLAAFWRSFWPRWAAMCALAALLGALRYGLAQPQFDEYSLATYNNRNVPATVVGVVAGEPDVRDTYTRLRIEARTLALGSSPPRQVRGLALVNAPRYPECRYGDELSISGSLESPPVFDTFDYRAYLARQGVYSQIRYAEDAPLTIERLSQGHGFLPFAWILAFKRQAQSVIGRSLPEPQASLLTGILLGVDAGIPANVQDAFRATGTSHIIAISGFNLVVLAGFLSAFVTRLFGKRYEFYVIAAGLLVYTILVGASASVVRAAIMSVLYVWARHLGRQSMAFNSLFVAAILMTLLTPNTLWDIGFQLSAAATLGLILYTDPLQGAFERALARVLPAERAHKIAGLFNDALIVTLAAQVTTLPLVAYTFRQLSPVSLLANLLILPAQPGVMLWGGLATIAGLIWLPLGQVIGWGAWLFLTWTIGVTELASKIPGASLSLGQIDVGWVVAYYVVLGTCTWWCSLPAERRAEWRTMLAGRITLRRALIGLAVAAALSVAAFVKLPDGKLHVDFLDVDYADAVFIQTPAGRYILVDAGANPSTILDHVGRRLPFWNHYLDVAIIARSDDAHLAAWIALLERYQVGLIVAPPAMAPPGGAAPAGTPFLNGAQTPVSLRLSEVIAAQRNAQIVPALVGTRVQLDEGVELEIVGAPATITGTESSSVRITSGNVAFLLAGESAPAKGWTGSTVLRVAKHGSRWANSPEMLEAINPSIAIISVDADNRWGLPSPEVLGHLSGRTILRTDQHGNIQTSTDGVQLWVWLEP